ncbi:MAG: type II secretion system protein [Clostridium fessum]
MSEKLRSKNGMTLTELLAAIVILGMIGTVLGGGVMMVKMFTRGRRIRQMQSRRCRSRRS